jgi:hypothetical protein
MSKLTLNQLWQIATQAEKAYMAALIAEGGSETAGLDLMYRPKDQSAHTRSLGRIFEQAQNDWRQRREEYLREGKL